MATSRKRYATQVGLISAGEYRIFPHQIEYIELDEVRKRLNVWLVSRKRIILNDYATEIKPFVEQLCDWLTINRCHIPIATICNIENFK